MATIESVCLKCERSATFGPIMHKEGRVGVMCKDCVEDWRRNALARYDQKFGAWGLPSTSQLLSDFAMGRKGVLRIGPDPRWVVRCAPLGGGLCWTVAALPEQEQAECFASFWGNFCYTEVMCKQLREGQRCDDAVLDGWEQSYAYWRPSLRPAPQQRLPASGRRVYFSGRSA